MPQPIYVSVMPSQIRRAILNGETPISLQDVVATTFTQDEAPCCMIEMNNGDFLEYHWTGPRGERSWHLSDSGSFDGDA